MATQTQTTPRLRDQLEATARHLSTLLPAEVSQTIDAGIESVKVADIAGHSLQAGSLAPDFSLPDAQGEPVTLSKLLKTGPVVLTFYRGNWCPYCQVQLRAYQAVLPDFSQRKATLVAVSPQTPDQTERTAHEKELSFPVLSDIGNLVARQYGLAYAVGDTLYNTLRGVGIDLKTYNGDASGELPLTGTFVIGTDRVIAWAQTDPDFKHRPDPADILGALDDLNSDG